jgi:hypothetical protein
MATNLLEKYGPNGTGTVKGLDNNTIGGYGGNPTLTNTYKPSPSYQSDSITQAVLPSWNGINTYSDQGTGLSMLSGGGGHF